MKNKIIPIFITSWFRPHFLERTIELIIERTTPGSYTINVYDNNSDKITKDILYKYLNSGKINSLVLDSRNTGCLYNKLVFQSMVESDNDFYCVTDNDVYPPLLTPDWLSQMIGIMQTHPEIAILAPQLPPQCLQTPYLVKEDVVYAKAIGNTLKIIRREAMASIISKITQKVGVYGDDGTVSELFEKNNWKVAFCRNIYCYHAGQTTDWGYKKDEISLDPRKQGYGKPFEYEVVNWDTYEPEPQWKI